LINFLAVIILVSGLPEEKFLGDISEKYASAEGIQWEVQSVVYSDVFEEAETTLVKFAYSPPDTISVTSKQEKILGIGDTLWVMSVRHRQVQKKSMAGYLSPFEFILNWNESYDLDGYTTDGQTRKFRLAGKEGVIPDRLVVSADPDNRIRSIVYVDSKGDEVTLTILKEKLSRPTKIDLFFRHIPDDYDLIDLTE
jgi:outer membrane lipoprotein-sorting protein